MNLIKIQHKAKVKEKGAKIDIPSASSSLEHDCRTSNLEHTDRQRGNENIDPARTPLNYDLAAPLRERLYDGASAIEVYHNKYKTACDKNGKALRADAVTLMSWVVTAPKDLPEEYYDEFFKGAYEWFVERYGEENVIAANVHMDETTPHMHFKFMPFVPDDKHGGVKLCAKGLESPISMKQIHPALQKALTERLGIEVKLLNGATANGNKTILELKIQTLESKIQTLTKQLNKLQQKVVENSDDIINNNITTKNLFDKWLDNIYQMAKGCLNNYYMSDPISISKIGVEYTFCQTMIKISCIIPILEDMLLKDITGTENIFVTVYGEDSDEVYVWRKFSFLYGNQNDWKEKNMWNKCNDDERLKAILTNKPCRNV